jgi:hypothetical protein
MTGDENEITALRKSGYRVEKEKEITCEIAVINSRLSNFKKLSSSPVSSASR